MSKNVATYISRIFDPPVTLSLVTILGIFRSGMAGTQLTTFLIILIFGIIGPPIVLLWIAVRNKHIGNWDVTERKQRIIPLTMLVGMLALDLMVISVFNNAFIFRLFMFYIIWLIGFLLITTVWKISGHTGVNALVFGLIVQWFGLPFLPLFLVLPFIAWARIVRKDHSVAQVVAGVLYSFLLLIVFFGI